MLRLPSRGTNRCRRLQASRRDDRGHCFAERLRTQPSAGSRSAEGQPSRQGCRNSCLNRQFPRRGRRRSAGGCGGMFSMSRFDVKLLPNGEFDTATWPHRHRPDQPRWQRGQLQRLPYAASFLEGASARARDLRQVPPRPRSSAARSLPGVQTRHSMGSQQGPAESGQPAVETRNRLYGRDFLRDLPYERHPRAGGHA